MSRFGWCAERSHAYILCHPLSSTCFLPSTASTCIFYLRAFGDSQSPLHCPTADWKCWKLMSPGSVSQPGNGRCQCINISVPLPLSLSESNVAVYTAIQSLINGCDLVPLADSGNLLGNVPFNSCLPPQSYFPTPPFVFPRIIFPKTACTQILSSVSVSRKYDDKGSKRKFKKREELRRGSI